MYGIKNVTGIAGFACFFYKKKTKTKKHLASFLTDLDIKTK